MQTHSVCYLLHPLEGHFDLSDCTVFVKCHTVDTGDPVITPFVGNGPPVIYDIPIIGPGRIDDGMVTGAGSDFFIGLQDGTDPLERPGHIIGHRVGHFVGLVAPTAFRPHEVVGTLTVKHKGSFDVPFGRYFPEEAVARPGFKTGKIISQNYRI